MRTQLIHLFRRLRSADPWHLALSLFLCCLLAALAIRADDGYRWSDWGFGDAQTMLSLHQWEEGGWFSNYLLFKPEGYAPNINLLDEPELRHHAHGICPLSSPNVGPRLWYTHYPAGYLLPYAAMFRVGLDSLASVRMLSVLFSVGALLLMYLVFARITSPRTSLLAVLYYGLSASFLGYADSLANQPVDDLLRFGFMLLVVLASRAADARKQRRWMVAAWVVEFALSLVSFDSVFFVYAWLIGWDLLEKRGFRWKTYLLFSLAPISAHGLQFLQNVWYLGWQDAIVDIKDAFLLKYRQDTVYNAGHGRIGTILLSLKILFGNASRLTPWMLLMLFLILVLYRRISGRESSDGGSVSGALLLILFLCGFAFVFVLPHAARMPYESRQMMPFIALLVSGVTWSFIDTFAVVLRRAETAEEGGAASARHGFRIAYLVFSGLMVLVVWYSFLLQDRKPVYSVDPILPEIRFAELLRTVPAANDPVFFSLGGFRIFWNPTYVPGYPQIMPLTEYYTGSRPILCFIGADSVADDLAVMVRKSRQRFSPIIIVTDMRELQQIVSRLQKKGVVREWSPKFYGVMGRIVADLTDSIVWETAHETDTHTRQP